MYTIRTVIFPLVISESVVNLSIPSLVIYRLSGQPASDISTILNPIIIDVVGIPNVLYTLLESTTK